MSAPSSISPVRAKNCSVVSNGSELTARGRERVAHGSDSGKKLSCRVKMGAGWKKEAQVSYRCHAAQAGPRESKAEVTPNPPMATGKRACRRAACK
eukprot:3673871-Pleurochrysis_carterae.AAC.1